MKDPLAGKREAIAEGELNHVTWPDKGKGCPVEIGDQFTLRPFSIQITHTRRTRSGGQWIWLAAFEKFYPQGKPYLLDRRGGYTDDPKAAMRAQDDPAPATLDRQGADARTEEHRAGGEPPEPEGVPPHEVSSLPTSIMARERFRDLRRQVDQERRMDQLASRVKKLQKRAERTGLDLGEEIDDLEATIARVENCLQRAA